MRKRIIAMHSISYLVLDVDGTLTDGKIYMGPNGELFKAFDVKDGYGISTILPSMRITPVVITGRKSEIVKKRCAELGIGRVHQQVSDKLATLLTIVESDGMSLANVAYIGDDLNDLRCMQAIRESGGLVGCPSNAVEEVKAVSHYVSSKSGGNGAVRDFLGWLCGRQTEDARDFLVDLTS